jgi:hypothetical protein
MRWVLPELEDERYELESPKRREWEGTLSTIKEHWDDSWAPTCGDLVQYHVT